MSTRRLTGLQFACVALIAVAVFLSYRFSSRLIAYLGETGTTVFLRLSSFILLCIGVSIIWTGLVDLIRPLLLERGRL